ncbi:RNA polymerase II C-terminal domain phosphatase-like 4 [Bienertia sinuspersici]
MEEMPCLDEYSATAFRYIDPNLTLTKQQINQIRDENLRLLLNRKKLQLLLDLDHTLIHARKKDKLKHKEKQRIKSIDDVYEIMGGEYVVKLRPGIREFLREINSMFDVSIYTLGGREYANEVHKLLESNAGFPKGSWVISREDCVKTLQKRLDVVLSHEQVVLIVDDTEEVWGDTCKKNLVKIDGYKFFPVNNCTNDGDVELERVLMVLKKVHGSFFKEDCSRRDVREVLKSISDFDRKRLVIKFGGKRLSSEANDNMDNNNSNSEETTCAVAAKRCRKLVIKFGSLGH